MSLLQSGMLQDDKIMYEFLVAFGWLMFYCFTSVHIISLSGFPRKQPSVYNEVSLSVLCKFVKESVERWSSFICKRNINHIPLRGGGLLI